MNPARQPTKSRILCRFNFAVALRRPLTGIFWLAVMVGVAWLLPQPAVYAVTVEAREMIGNPSGNELTLRDATVEEQGYSLSAQTIRYNKTTGNLETVGETTLEGKYGTMTGTDLAYNTKVGLITGNGIRYFDPVKKIYLEAAKIRLFTDQEYFELEDALVTNCDPNDPGWHVRFSFLRYYPNNFAYGYHLRYYMHSVPGAYVPVFSFPTVTERATGFLTPEIDYTTADEPSKSTGFRLRTPFFWNIRQDHDLTVTPDFIERRGVGLGLEYNYAFEEGMLGQIDAWGINESNANRKPADEFGMDADDPANPPRYRFNFKHRQTVNDPGRFYLTYAKKSDNEIDHEYFSAETSLETASLIDATYLYPWRNGFMSVSYFNKELFLNRSVYDRETDYRTALIKAPEIELRHRLIGFPDDAFITAGHNRLTNFTRQEGWQGQRNILTPSLEYDDTFTFLNVSAGARSYLHNYDVNYSPPDNTAAGADSNTKSFAYQIAEADAKVSLELFRPFTLGNGQTASELAVIPSVAAHYTQDTDQRNGLSASPTAVTSGTNADYTTYSAIFDEYDIRYGYATVTNRLDIVYRSLVPGDNRRIWQFSVYEIYDLWRQNSAAETESFFSGPFIEEKYRENPYGRSKLPYRAELFFQPSRNYTFTAFSRYVEDTRTFVETNFRADITGKNGSAFGIGYNKNRKAYKELDNTLHSARQTAELSAALPFATYWTVRASGEWDINREYTGEGGDLSNRQIVASNLRLEKKDPCYSFYVAYEEKLKNKTGAAGQTPEYVERKVKAEIRITDW